ncbi:MAG TPA: 1-acyl-sn-glycerol-3-phosphate acyltransferase [Micromonosporaceae bacterium]|jgi:hypothetical protein
MSERRDVRAAVLRAGLHRMVAGGLRGVWQCGEVPDGAFVWAANHHSWWDPFIASALLHSLHREPSLIMQQDNLDAYGFVRRLGVFGTAEPRRGLGYLGQGRVLVVFPEGRLRAPAATGPLAGGAAWYARTARVPLCAVAVRVLMRGQQAAEAYVSVAAVDSTGTAAAATQRLRSTLDGLVHSIDTLNAGSDPEAPLPGFQPVLGGRRSWHERIDLIGRWRPWRR